MDNRYADAIKAAGQGKLLKSFGTPAIVWNLKMLEKVDETKVDFSKWP
jgi:hypothetical protein